MKQVWEISPSWRIREGIKITKESCVLCERENRCAYSGGTCELQCGIQDSVVSDVKKLIDDQVHTMAKHSKQRIVFAIAREDALIMKSKNNEVIGFVYLVHWVNHVEIAGLVIRGDFRQLGLGKRLFGIICNLAQCKYPNKEILFFGNEVSKKIGAKYNFLLLPKLLTKPEFHSLCKDCTRECTKPKQCRCHVMVQDNSRA